MTALLFLVTIPASVLLGAVACALVMAVVLLSPVLALGLGLAVVVRRWPMLRWSALGFVAAMALVGWSEAWGMLADHVRAVSP